MPHFGSLDTRINDTWPSYNSTLKASRAVYVAYVHDSAKHGFQNDSTTRYSPTDAELSWSRTIDFFEAHLS